MQTRVFWHTCTMASVGLALLLGGIVIGQRFTGSSVGLELGFLKPTSALAFEARPGAALLHDRDIAEGGVLKHTAFVGTATKTAYWTDFQLANNTSDSGLCSFTTGNASTFYHAVNLPANGNVSVSFSTPVAIGGASDRLELTCTVQTYYSLIGFRAR